MSTSKQTKAKRRALLIGIRYVDQKGEETPNHLGGCWNDVDRMNSILQTYFGFDANDITIMKDVPDNFNGKLYPTKANIRHTIKTLIKHSHAGDTLFFSYSGHGTQIKDINSDEKKEITIDSETGKVNVSSTTGRAVTKRGSDEAMCGWNGSEIENIDDDSLHRWMVTDLKKGVSLRAFFDCCCSGSILDIPYRYSCVQDSETMVNVGRPSEGKTDDIGWLEDLTTEDTRFKDSASKDVLIISGCRDPESSMDVSFSGIRYGALTYMMNKLVERCFKVQKPVTLPDGKVMAPHIFTWYTFITNLYLYVAKDFPSQNPQLSTTNKKLLLQPITL